jgi:hypothetical protein
MKSEDPPANGAGDVKTRINIRIGEREAETIGPRGDTDKENLGHRHEERESNEL